MEQVPLDTSLIRNESPFPCDYPLHYSSVWSGVGPEDHQPALSMGDCDRLVLVRGTHLQ